MCPLQDLDIALVIAMSHHFDRFGMPEQESHRSNPEIRAADTHVGSKPLNEIGVNGEGRGIGGLQRLQLAATQHPPHPGDELTGAKGLAGF